MLTASAPTTSVVLEDKMQSPSMLAYFITIRFVAFMPAGSVMRATVVPSGACFTIRQTINYNGQHRNTTQASMVIVRGNASSYETAFNTVHVELN
jgi:hypothetical protein